MAIGRFLFRLFAVLIGVVLLYLAYVSYAVWHASTLDQREDADAIVVLGAAQYNGTPSPVLRARLDHAAQLYKEGVAPRIVVTGGRAPGDTTTEASASAAYLGTKGVPDSDVLREVDGRTSWQSLQAATLFMSERDIDSIVLVSDPFHSARVEAMAEDLGMSAQVSPTQTSPIQGSSRYKYFVKEIISVAVGNPFGWSRLASLERNFSAS